MSSCVILKHGNPCGVSLGKTQSKAYKKALQCDPLSAFGGIVAFNKSLSKETAKDVSKLFTEVVVAPDFDREAIEFLSNKKNLILVRYTSSKEKTLISLKSTNFRLLQYYYTFYKTVCLHSTTLKLECWNWPKCESKSSS